VLGIVTGGVTVLACVMFLLTSLSGGDPASVVMLVGGLPCAVGAIAGGIRLLAGHRRGLLLGSALASVGVLLLGLLVGVSFYDGEDALAIVVFVVLGLPLPIVTAVLAAQRTVKGWSEDPRLG
jgi:hypothetical protein